MDIATFDSWSGRVGIAGQGGADGWGGPSESEPASFFGTNGANFPATLLLLTSRMP